MARAGTGARSERARAPRAWRTEKPSVLLSTDKNFWYLLSRLPFLPAKVAVFLAAVLACRGAPSRSRSGAAVGRARALHQANLTPSRPQRESRARATRAPAQRVGRGKRAGARAPRGHASGHHLCAWRCAGEAGEIRCVFIGEGIKPLQTQTQTQGWATTHRERQQLQQRGRSWPSAAAGES